MSALLWLYWPWLASGVAMILLVALVDRDARLGVPVDQETARAWVLGSLVALSVGLLLFGAAWQTWLQR